MLVNDRFQKVRQSGRRRGRRVGLGLALPILACLWLAAVLRCPADEAKPDIAPPAKWVVPIPYNPRAKLDPVDPSLEMRWILKDRQINAQNNESFNHEVRQVLTPAGVNYGSHIKVDYDPSYQLLTFHWVKVWRGTNALNRLDPDKIELTQAGLDTGQLLFNAEKSALLLLEDVRVGDVIDYAYTVQGNNPIFAGSFTHAIDAQAYYPMERSTTRLLWPLTRRLYVKNHGTDVKYTAVRKGDVTEFAWDFRKVPGWRIEPPLPIWYQPLPWVQLSEFQKWADVNRLVLGLFTNTAPLSPELARQISEWKRLPTPEDRVLAALRFVQDEIRYLGIETGESGYKPGAPSAVFARRFGDCKDKSFLLVTILRALGVEAWPTLVNTTLRQTVFEMHPSTAVFDHAIALVNLAGQSFWLDATANYQRGPLSVRSWRNYGCGLVIRPGATALTIIPPCPVLPKTTVTEYVRLGNLDGDSDLKLITVAEGSDAEMYRQHYTTTARQDIEQAHLNYYAKFYSDISETAPLVYTDNEDQNKIEVDEFYSVRRIWSRLPDETFFHCRIYPENIEAVINSPAVSMRTMPLGIAYPVHQFFHAEITVPDLPIIRADDQVVDNPAFYFRRVVSIGTGRLLLDYEFRSLSDVVPTEAVPNYIRQLNSVVDLLGYTIPSD
jgi:transglutaminase-like putative cysteine protease